MTDEEFVKRMLWLDARGDIVWKNNQGEFTAVVNGIRVELSQCTLDRTHQGVILTLTDPADGVPSSLPEPLEKERISLKKDMRELFDRVSKKALGPEEIWKKLSLRVAGYDKF